MRLPAILVLLAASACSAEPEPVKADAPKVTAIQAGQWETTTEVTKLTQNDNGTPKIDTPAGTKSSDSVCIGEAEVRKPNPALFAGSKDECEYDNFYMSGGTLNASLKCTRPGLSGSIMLTAYGDYKADSFDGRVDTVTYLATDGDVSISAKISGRRVGACLPAAPA